jgi:hypothetical protein
MRKMGLYAIYPKKPEQVVPPPVYSPLPVALFANNQSKSGLGS